MGDISNSRQAICDFLNEKKPLQTNNAASEAPHTAANDPLKALAAVSAAGLGQAWNQHPLKQGYEQIMPLAQETVRQHPWLSLGAASAVGALLVLSPGLRRQALQTLQGQLPPQLSKLF